MTDRALHPSVSGILRYFATDHLPPHLRTVSADFEVLAHMIATRSTVIGVNGPETTVALRKLLEAKDAAVRAVLDADPTTVAETSARFEWYGTDTPANAPLQRVRDLPQA